jgi:hypothetical protein
MDPFSFSWVDTIAGASMHRITPTPQGPDAVCLSNQTFDRLLAIAIVAVQANAPGTGSTDYRVTCREDGSYSASIESDMFGRATGEGSTLLQALVAAKRAFAPLVEARIR